MRKVAIITGVTSFLGSSVAKKLLSKDFIVFGVVRPNSKNISKLTHIEGLKIIEIDFENLKTDDFKNVDRLNIDKIKNENVDITFLHFGWGHTLDRLNFAMQMLNIDYSMKVLEFAKMLNAKRFIFAGSQGELSDSPYGMAKKQFSERATRDLKNNLMQFIHLRIFSIYGSGDRETSLIKSLVRSIKENKDIDLSLCDYKWNYLYIDDFTEIVYRFIDKKIKTGTYDVASDDTRMLREYVESAKASFNSNIKLNFGKRMNSSETFSLPHIEKTIKAVGDIDFTKFEEGILKV